MVRPKSKLENHSKNRLIEELLGVEDISSKVSDLASCFDVSLRRFEFISSKIAITKNFSWLLCEKGIQLELNAINGTGLGYIRLVYGGGTGSTISVNLQK